MDLCAETGEEEPIPDPFIDFFNSETSLFLS
jgi:hypothetical protein